MKPSCLNLLDVKSVNLTNSSISNLVLSANENTRVRALSQLCYDFPSLASRNVQSLTCRYLYKRIYSTPLSCRMRLVGSCLDFWFLALTVNITSYLDFVSPILWYTLFYLLVCDTVMQCDKLQEKVSIDWN